MADTQDKQLIELLQIQHDLTEQEKELVQKAFVFSVQAHEGQHRASGSPYFIHAYETARILAELGMDGETIAAGLLHDTIEDGSVTAEEVEKQFGTAVRFLVEGVTKLGKLQYHGLKRHTESLQKLFVAMAHDVRVIIIKLADRLHNMRTLEYIPAEKRERIALETREIYAPIAHRLGIGQLKGELEDLAFKHLEPKMYQKVEAVRKAQSKTYAKRLESVLKTLKRKMADENLSLVKSDYRVKYLYSLYRKLEQYDWNTEEMYDIAALRLIVKSIDDCYRTLGLIHKQWKPLPNRIKDYIASPKPNGYQSLHTTVFTGDGGIVEIQIRTSEMHREAEYGIASHANYKERRKSTGITRLLSMIKPSTGSVPTWIEELATAEHATDDPHAFLKLLKEDFFGDRIFVFTPKGEVVDLPEQATPIDYAYAIHTDIGDHVSGAKVNGKFVSIDTELTNGDIVEIETKNSSRPTRKWLEHAKSTFAKRKIRQALEQQKN